MTTTYELPAFLERQVHFPDGISYELAQPLTDFRKCHDGTPAESRIVFTCRRLAAGTANDAEADFVVKIKVQTPDASSSTDRQLAPGPSTTTSAEIKALEIFSKASSVYAPHLVAFKQDVQGPRGLLPGGYLTFTIMTKMPGQSLFDLQYWTLATEERDEIVQMFLRALRSIYSLGIQPQDCALRNILWEKDTKKCTIIDFELWQSTTETIADQTKELQRWGVARRPPSRDWWAEWNSQGR